MILNPFMISFFFVLVASTCLPQLFIFWCGLLVICHCQEVSESALSHRPLLYCEYIGYIFIWISNMQSVNNQRFNHRYVLWHLPVRKITQTFTCMIMSPFNLLNTLINLHIHNRSHFFLAAFILWGKLPRLMVPQPLEWVNLNQHLQHHLCLLLNQGRNMISPP